MFEGSSYRGKLGDFSELFNEAFNMRNTSKSSGNYDHVFIQRKTTAGLVIKVAMPGFEKDEVVVQMLKHYAGDSLLTIDTNPKNPEPDFKFNRLEFKVPEMYTDEVTVTLKNGVCRIFIKKKNVQPEGESTTKTFEVN